jgi:hypothetical protein
MQGLPPGPDGPPVQSMVISPATGCVPGGRGVNSCRTIVKTVIQRLHQKHTPEIVGVSS